MGGGGRGNCAAQSFRSRPPSGAGFWHFGRSAWLPRRGHRGPTQPPPRFALFKPNGSFKLQLLPFPVLPGFNLQSPIAPSWLGPGRAAGQRLCCAQPSGTRGQTPGASWGLAAAAGNTVPPSGRKRKAPCLAGDGRTGLLCLQSWGLPLLLGPCPSRRAEPTLPSTDTWRSQAEGVSVCQTPVGSCQHPGLSQPWEPEPVGSGKPPAGLFRCGAHTKSAPTLAWSRFAGFCHLSAAPELF